MKCTNGSCRSRSSETACFTGGRKKALSPSTKARLLVVAGTNGAGKTTLIDLLPSIVVGDRVDPDRIALTLQGGAPGNTLAAGRIALRRISDALRNERDLTIETTLAGHQPLELVARARMLGYHVSLIFVGTSDARLNVDRIRRRIEAGGHAIAEEDVYRRYIRSLEHLMQVVSLADSIAVYDNSGEPRDLRIIYDRDGRVERTAVDAPAWFTKLGALPHPVDAGDASPPTSFT